MQDLQCYPRGKSFPLRIPRTNLQVLVLVVNVSGLQVLIVKDSAFCKQSTYDHVKSINSVTSTVHEVMVKNGLLTDIRYPRRPIYKSLSLSSDFMQVLFPVLILELQVLVLVLEPSVLDNNTEALSLK